MEQDENFYYIAGYTAGGAPYGITWEQAAEEGLLDDSDDESDDTDIEIFSINYETPIGSIKNQSVFFCEGE